MPRAVKGQRFGGRVKGTPNKVTKDVKAVAQAYGPEAIQVLYAIMSGPRQPPQARIAAAKEILDRGYGRPPQALTGADGAALFPATVIHVHE